MKNHEKNNAKKIRDFHGFLIISNYFKFQKWIDCCLFRFFKKEEFFQTAEKEKTAMFSDFFKMHLRQAGKPY